MRPPALKESIAWTGIGVLVAVVGLLMGFIYWQHHLTRNEMKAGFESVREELGKLSDLDRELPL